MIPDCTRNVPSIDVLQPYGLCSGRRDKRREGRQLRGTEKRALSNDFRGHSRKRKNVFIHHYCHGL